MVLHWNAKSHARRTVLDEVNEVEGCTDQIWRGNQHVELLLANRHRFRRDEFHDSECPIVYGVSERSIM